MGVYLLLAMLLWKILPSLWLSLAFAHRGHKTTSLSILHLHSSTPGPPTTSLSPQWHKSDVCAVPRKLVVIALLFAIPSSFYILPWMLGWGGRRALWGFKGCFRGFRATTWSSGSSAVCRHLPTVMPAVLWQGLLPESRSEGWLSRENPAHSVNGS